jgi:hypothetical protein
VLWNLYWRGSAALRERIEAEIDPTEDDAPKRPATQTVDPQQVLDEARRFVALARSGAYMGGDRSVSPRERTRWRFTFGRLVSDAQRALRTDDTDTATTALEHLTELACQLRDYEYFHSQDPIEAARFVVSDAAALLWAKALERRGFSAFAERAAPQLIRWESQYGWTRSGYGQTSEKETSLAEVLTRMLTTPDMWAGFAGHYLAALDQLASSPMPKASWRSADYEREQRTGELAEWHLLLLDHLIDSDAEDQLDRLAHHPALGGPELYYLQAQLAFRRGDLDSARKLVNTGLDRLPGHTEMLAFAVEIDAPLSPVCQKIIKERTI